MAVEMIITPEIRAIVGNQTEPQRCVDEVSRSELRRWVIATLDDNPLWYDEEYANKTKFGPGCLPGPYPQRQGGHWKRPMGTPDPVRELDFDDDFRYGDPSLEPESIKIPLPEGVGMFHGGDEVEYFQFPRIGDTISFVTKIVGVEEKTGRSGKLGIFHIDRTYTNQRGEVLLINHHVGIAREMPGESWRKRQG